MLYLLGHQGWTDWLSQYGIYINYLEKHTECAVLVVDPKQIQFVVRLFKGTTMKIVLMEVDKVHPTCTTCVRCHSPFRTLCQRARTSCFLPNPKYVPLQGICAFDNFTSWDSVYEGVNSFIPAFYTYHNLPIEDSYRKFNVIIDPVSCPVPDTPYVVYHFQPSLPIKLTTQLQQINLDNSSSDVLSSIPLIMNAREIHLVQSLYAVLIYLLQQRYGMFETIPIYVYPRAGSDLIYENLCRNPSLPNWVFVPTRPDS